MHNLFNAAKRKYKKTLYGPAELPELDQLDDIQELTVELDSWTEYSKTVNGSDPCDIQPIVYWLMDPRGLRIFKAILYPSRGFILYDNSEDNDYLRVRFNKHDDDTGEILNDSKTILYNLFQTSRGFQVQNAQNNDHHDHMMPELELTRSFKTCLWLESKCKKNFDSSTYQFVVKFGNDNWVEATIFPRKLLCQGNSYNTFVLKFSDKQGDRKIRLLGVALTLYLVLDKAALGAKTMMQDFIHSHVDYIEEAEIIKDAVNLAKLSMFSLTGVADLPVIKELKDKQELYIELSKSSSVDSAINRFIFQNDAEFDPIVFWIKDEHDNCLLRAIVKHDTDGFTVQNLKGDEDFMRISLPSKENNKDSPFCVGHLNHECGARIFDILQSKRTEHWYIKLTEDFNIELLRLLSPFQWFLTVFHLGFDPYTYKVKHNNKTIARITSDLNDDGSPGYKMVIGHDLNEEPKLRTVLLGLLLLLTLRTGYPHISKLLKL